MTDRRAGEHDTAGGAGTVKRRGILAAAGAAIAALVAKQASQPVAAFGGTGDQGPLQLGSNPWYIGGSSGGNNAAVSSATTVLQASPNFANFAGNNGADRVVFEVDARPAGPGGATLIDGIYAYGATAVTGYGAGGLGLRGLSDVNTGVYGQSTSGIGVYGLSGGPYGVVGGTIAAGGYGGYFATSGAHSFGLRAEVQGASTTGSYGLYATAAAPNYAAYFNGAVYVNGSFTVADMTQKHGLLRGPDGVHHLMYTVEAPESWAEDFGEGTLTNGKAEVAIDPLFASLVHTEGEYHAFITQHGHHHLAVTHRGPAGFTVEADAAAAKLKGQTASDLNGTFSWRVVAKPKTDKKVERLGVYTVPPEPPPLPPLPKVPDLAKTPPTKP